MIELVKVIMLKGEKGDAGSSGDYAGLENKPSINGVTLNGNKTAEDLNLAEASRVYTKDQVYRKEETYNKSEVYAKGDSFPDWNGKRTRWDTIQISSVSTRQEIFVTPTEDCYIIVGGGSITLSAQYERDGDDDWWYPIGESSIGDDTMIRPVKANTRLKLIVPANTLGFYALIPTIG